MKADRIESLEAQEWEMQCTVMDWVRAWSNHYPVLQYMHANIPEAKRDGKRAGIAKKMGLTKGQNIDLELLWPNNEYLGLLIELKTPEGPVSKEQQNYLLWLRQQGFHASVCRSIETAIDVIKDYIR